MSRVVKIVVAVATAVGLSFAAAHFTDTAGQVAVQAHGDPPSGTCVFCL